MNSTYLNAKCKGILRKLLNNNSYLSLQKLAEELNISQRSIYYDVCRINERLSEMIFRSCESYEEKDFF